MKSVAIWVLLGCIAAGAVRAEDTVSSPRATGIPLDRFVARVNDRVITFGDILLLANEQEMRIRNQTASAEVESKLRDLYRAVLERLVDRALILEEAKRRGAALQDKAIEDYISQIVRDQFGNDRSAFLQALSRDHLSLDAFRDQTRDNLLVSLLRRQEISDRVRVSPRELRDAYDQNPEKYSRPEEVKLSVILLNAGATPGDRDSKRTQGQRIAERLRAGEDFAVVAREISEGYGAANGGSWDWIRSDDIMPELRETVKTLAPGEISALVESEKWFFLVRLDARRPSRTIPFEDVRQQIETELQRDAEDRAYRDWMTSLKDRHYVKLLSEPWIESP